MHMKSIKSKIAAVMATMFLLSPTLVGAEGDAAQGEIKFNTCAGCHALPNYFNAFPVYHVPKLAGQYADYIVSALQSYAAETRDHGGMYANAASLSDEDMQDIATYLSALPDRSGAVSRGDIEAGKAKSTTCDTCHAGDAGAAQTPRPPVLAGQHQDYLMHALRSYKDGSRENPVMYGMAAALSEEDIKNIAAYYSSQEPGLGPVTR